MSYLFAIIAYLSLVLSVHGSNNCFTSHIKDRQTGVITTHSITKVDCNCPCTANRGPDGTCRSCGHKVIEKKPFSTK